MKIKLNTKHISLISLFAFIFILYAFSMSFLPGGFVGTTRKGGVNLGCVCHGDTATSNVSVFISGPDSVATGQTVTYSVSISQGPAVTGGFNVANARDGGSDTLTLNRVLNDTMVRKQDGELTHTHPKPFVSGTVSWQFTYKANNTIGYDTLFATGNSTNNNNKSDSDKWNWSQNKLVRIYNPIGIINISGVAEGFSLEQNYPNPFNPMTNVKFQIPNKGLVKLTVYDIQGREAEILVNESLAPGTYEVSFNASGLATGIYFYTINAGEFTATKRMMLIK